MDFHSKDYNFSTQNFCSTLRDHRQFLQYFGPLLILITLPYQIISLFRTRMRQLDKPPWAITTVVTLHPIYQSILISHSYKLRNFYGFIVVIYILKSIYRSDLNQTYILFTFHLNLYLLFNLHYY